MNYFLDDIKTILEGAGYSSIYINRLIEKSTSTSLNEAIFLFSEGGEQGGSQVEYSRDFSIYVRRKTNAQALTDSEAIWAVLQQARGGLRGDDSDASIIRIITTRQTPYPYTTDGQSNIYEYIITMTAHITDTRFLSIK